ncbi:hypothetical protein KAR02_04850 [Candidatus Bipolaricaulota bacterium]|nr:hypothetical protein [Candidatus Bipolaricaulota bacterium]
MMYRKLFALLLIAAVALSVAAADGMKMDEIVTKYPGTFTKILTVDLAKLSGDEVLNGAVLGPLAAANHPVNGILRSLGILGLDVADVVHATYATGSGMTPYSLVLGVDTDQAMQAVGEIEAGAGAPGAPYQNWDMETIVDTSVVITGGRFGPFEMQWGYFAKDGVLWIGSEVGLIAPPDLDRLRASTESILKRAAGEAPVFDELLMGLAVGDGDISFVRASDTSVDRPLETGDEAMAYSVTFDGDSARVRFLVRFSSIEDATASADKLSAGTSSYLAQDLYHGELADLTQADALLLFEVTTDLAGIVGLLMLTVPII